MMEKAESWTIWRSPFCCFGWDDFLDGLRLNFYWITRRDRSGGVAGRNIHSCVVHCDVCLRNQCNGPLHWKTGRKYLQNSSRRFRRFGSDAVIGSNPMGRRARGRRRFLTRQFFTFQRTRRVGFGHFFLLSHLFSAATGSLDQREQHRALLLWRRWSKRMDAHDATTKITSICPQYLFPEKKFSTEILWCRLATNQAIWFSLFFFSSFATISNALS